MCSPIRQLTTLPTNSSIQVIHRQPARQRSSRPAGSHFSYIRYTIHSAAPPVSAIVQCVQPRNTISDALYKMLPRQNTDPYSADLFMRSPCCIVRKGGSFYPFFTSGKILYLYQKSNNSFDKLTSSTKYGKIHAKCCVNRVIRRTVRIHNIIMNRRSVR